MNLLPKRYVKLTGHAPKGMWVVNTPGCHAQRYPLVFKSLERAEAAVARLVYNNPGFGVLKVGSF